MRIVDDAHRDTSAFVLDTRTEYSGCLAEHGSPRPRPNASRHKFAAAISWLAAHLIESLAAYGEAMYPCFVDPGDLTNGQKPERDSERHRPAEFEHRSEVQWLSAGASQNAEDPWLSASVQTASPGPIAKTTSPAVRLWARMRAERRVRLTITKLAALDDHALKDIGIIDAKSEVLCHIPTVTDDRIPFADGASLTSATRKKRFVLLIAGFFDPTNSGERR